MKRPYCLIRRREYWNYRLKSKLVLVQQGIQPARRKAFHRIPSSVTRYYFVANLK